MSPSSANTEPASLEDAVLFEHSCHVIKDKVWPGENGTVTVTRRGILWVPTGGDRLGGSTLWLDFGSMSGSEILEPRLPAPAKPVAVYVGDHRVEFILTWIWWSQETVESFHRLIQEGIATKTQDSEGLEVNLHLTHARLHASLWLAVTAVFTGVMLIATAEISVLTVVVFVVFIATLGRASTTVLPLLFKRNR